MKSRLALAVVLVGVAVAAASTYAFARGQGEQTFYGCVADADGKLRVVPVAGSCKNGESAISWNSVGPSGLNGQNGRDGRDGVQGPAGPVGAQGPPGPAGGEAANAVDATMTVKGQKQGVYSSGPMILIGLSHEIVSPRDAASGLPTGKRQHKPLVITKELDKATPLLLNSLYTNENLPEVAITLRNGGNAVATIKLTNASIASRIERGMHEEIAFTYQKITWTWIDGGVTAEDDWEAPVA